MTPTRIPLSLRHRISHCVLDHQWMERFHGQHGGGGWGLRRCLLVRAGLNSDMVEISATHDI